MKKLTKDTNICMVINGEQIYGTLMINAQNFKNFKNNYLPELFTEDVNSVIRKQIDVGYVSNCWTVYKQDDNNTCYLMSGKYYASPDIIGFIKCKNYWEDEGIIINDINLSDLKTIV